MQNKGKTDLKVIVSDNKLMFARVNDVVENAWNDRYVCVCAAE